MSEALGRVAKTAWLRLAIWRVVQGGCSELDTQAIEALVMKAKSYLLQCPRMYAVNIG